MTPFILVVVRDFGDYKRGDQITDESTIAAVLATHNASNVVKTNPSSAPSKLN